ncbi:tetraacyldisaccharide 4'-kinase [Limnohabitans sp. 2KL-1]|jgi:tetraacyldisaccharide 4'-kinase|uniref:tetraacyldisaccharide 4'-kinase n=1 Tax=Limnohabitans sp. 2KL-1 TaxID=1100699 RepID=UPI000D373F5A|nr:tetraacyldisaccharide 4'-kinase [Limnohabitans sp. 2KL-1]PUE48878.1 tetraacyldisaccharide 4'-kinase [Limnohabitans sp. 2KL-1]
MSIASWLHRELPRVWQSRSLTARLLTPIALIHGVLLSVRKLAYQIGWQKQQQLPVPVIVVGNVVAGGAGKTPLTMALVQHLLRQGWKPGVISRGHGRQSRDTRAVWPDSSPAETGDEPLLIRQKTGVPVWVGASRAHAGRALLDQHPEVNILVCDDGLQHLALARDLEICVMDERAIGNGWLLPAGPLREPWPKPVDLVVHTGLSNLKGGYQARRELADVAHDAQGRRVALASLKNHALDAVAGLARPEAFFNMLREHGLTLQQTTALPDHFDFAAWPTQALTRPLLCTEKDAAKLWRHQPDALAVPLHLTPEPAFWDALDRLLPAPNKAG